MFRKPTTYFCFLLYFFSLVELSANSFETEQDEKDSLLQEVKENEPVERPLFFTLREDGGRGVGYNHGYATIEALLFSSISENWLSFIDLRMHNFFNNKQAFNAGIGVRKISDTFCNVVGINFYYDFRNAHHSHFNQVGMGLEMLSRRWSLRLNGYLPVGKTKGLICSHAKEFDEFFISRKNFDVALKGISFEGEVLINKLCSSTAAYAFGGPYFYNGETCRDVIGGKAGIRVKFKQLLSITLSGTYDSVFNARMQGLIALTFPFGKTNEIHCTLPGKIAKQGVQRNEIIVLDKFCKWKWNY